MKERKCRKINTPEAPEDFFNTVEKIGEAIEAFYDCCEEMPSHSPEKNLSTELWLAWQTYLSSSN